jgi:hypothetical protein
MSTNFLRRTLAAVAVLALGALAPALSSAAAPVDLAPFRALAQDTLKLVQAGDMAGALKKEAALESASDAKGIHDSQPKLDDQMDAIKDALTSKDAKKATDAINKYIALIDAVQKPAAH